MDADCFIYAALRPSDRTPWYDVTLSRRPGVGFALPGLGALTPGYVLVSPEEHVPSIGSLAHRRRLAFAAYLEDLLARYGKLGEYVFWEHGDSYHSARA